MPFKRTLKLVDNGQSLKRASRLPKTTFLNDLHFEKRRRSQAARNGRDGLRDLVHHRVPCVGELSLAVVVDVFFKRKTIVKTK